jgi:hypothetical protein
VGNCSKRTDGNGDSEGRLETSSRQVGPETESSVLFAEETLKTSWEVDRASGGFSSERPERWVPGKLGPRAGSEGLEEKNSKRGAALRVVNNYAEVNAASRR